MTCPAKLSYTAKLVCVDYLLFGNDYRPESNIQQLVDGACCQAQREWLIDDTDTQKVGLTETQKAGLGDVKQTQWEEQSNSNHMQKEAEQSLDDDLEKQENELQQTNKWTIEEYLIRLLETGYFTAVSEDILKRMVEHHPFRLTNRILLALLPPYAREMNLYNCTDCLTLMGLVEGLKKRILFYPFRLTNRRLLALLPPYAREVILYNCTDCLTLMGLVVEELKKCSNLQRLNLQNCSQLLHADLFTLVGLMNEQLTTLNLEGNSNVTDEIVQTAIMSLPNLTTLNISCCGSITDDVFLLDPVLQLKRETSQKPEKGDYSYKLSCVDMSGISSISAVAVRHLSSLCGPNLRQLNIAWSTQVDSTALFYLAGYNFPTIIDLVLGRESELRKERELKEYITELKEIKELYLSKDRQDKGHGMRSISEVPTSGSKSVESNSSVQTTLVERDIANLELLTLENKPSIDTGQNVEMDKIILPCEENTSQSTQISGKETGLEIGAACLDDIDVKMKVEENTPVLDNACDNSKELETNRLLNDEGECDNQRQTGGDTPNLTNEITKSALESAQTICDFLSKDEGDDLITKENLTISHLDRKLGIIESDIVRSTYESQNDMNEQHSDINSSCFVCSTINQQVSKSMKSIHTDSDQTQDNETDTTSCKDQTDCYKMNITQNQPTSSDTGQENFEQDFVPDYSAENVPNQAEAVIGDSSLTGINKYPMNVTDTSDLEAISRESEAILHTSQMDNADRSDTAIPSVEFREMQQEGIQSHSETDEKDHARTDTPGKAKPVITDTKFIDHKHSNEQTNVLNTHHKSEQDRNTNDDKTDTEITRASILDKAEAVITKTKDNNKNNNTNSDTNNTDAEVLSGQMVFKPGIVSLDITNIKFVNRKLGQLCLRTFLQKNKDLQKLEVSWKGLTEEFLKDVLPNLNKLVEVSLEECTFIQNGGLAALLRHCQNLRTINLRGVVFIKDMAMTPLYTMSNLTKLNLAESEISDATLFRISNRLHEKLTDLDLSWCEGITEKGINFICVKCSQLESLVLRSCPVSNLTLQIMAQHCPNMQELLIDSVEGVSGNEFSDTGLLEIAENLLQLQILDISWNLSITNLAICSIMNNLSRLREVHMKGLKQITCTPFLPIVSGVRDENSGMVKEFWVDEFSNNLLTASCLRRSTVFAPNLRVLDLEYSDLVEDKRLELIVKVCRGSLQVTDYYGRFLVPDEGSNLVISTANCHI